MDWSWLGAILVGAGCLALGCCIGARFPMAARFAKATALVGRGGTTTKSNKDKPKEPLEIEKLADVLDDFKMVFKIPTCFPSLTLSHIVLYCIVL